MTHWAAWFLLFKNKKYMLKNKTNNKYSTSIFVSQSMGNFETLEHFIKHKLLNSEECIL